MELHENQHKSPYICFHCYVPSSTQPLHRCGGCQLVAYCSKECQQDDWSSHKPICKEFPVVNGLNVFHTTKPWNDHLANLLKRAASLPVVDQNDVNLPLKLPKVCNICRESRPSLLTICKCNCVFYCNKKCSRKDHSHKKICSILSEMAKKSYLKSMRIAYLKTIMSMIDELYRGKQLQRGICCPEGIAALKIHVITNKAYYDAKSWEKIFHYDFLPNLNQLEIDFIVQDLETTSSFNFEGTIKQLECEFCPVSWRKAKVHIIKYFIHQKPYHMFFSSPEYSEPDIVIVYGVSYISNDIHSEISFRNMTYNKDVVLILTDSTLDLVVKGSQIANKARPMDALVVPMRNRLRGFGSNKAGLNFDASATNEKYYFTCLKRK